ncbi:transglycosylase domain-containing protein [Nitrosospira sp. Is2]|uniref:transglycosylase domain-containing protein n=1 Tax=Nitrosospira sp. Is2 TaxID=3080532 RepID=UPI0029543D90|nr:transglycosylase domain-containing protein [Nitrosospira sp. Is2]WON73194.1 transglycosylase domain-containing protein [Nitrosospira sp. Is2]
MRRVLKLFAFTVLILLLVALSIAAFLLYREAETSAYQARHLTTLLQDVRWEMQPGRSDLHLSQAGPYDIRLGYSRLPELLQSLTKHGFEVQAQARVSPRMQELVEQGLFIPYPEKSQAGLEITAGNGKQLYRANFPGRVYDHFESVPSVVTDSLLFIENRDLLDTAHPKKNPAVDWTRLGKAVMDKSIQFFREEHDVPGGSTLATQIEKYRHSPNGMTMSAEDKLQQMASASVRAYLYGENTLPVRKQIVVDYLNTVPLAAAPGFGETNGLGDALWAWYGMDFDETNHILHSRFVQGDALVETALRYKHVLSLMIAQRRPSYYLLAGRKELAELTDSYLRVLAQAGVIEPALTNVALKLPLRFRDTAALDEARSFSAQKAVNAVRVRIATQLGLRRLYDLDRLDLSVQSTLDADLQKKTTDLLRNLKDSEYARTAGLYGHRMLETEDPGKIIYSFTLSELTPQGAKFRIMADNFEQPLDINQGTKLDLGSTAKLRTLVTYLEIIETLHGKYAGLAPNALRKQDIDPSDVLSRWAVGYLLQAKDKSLAAMLNAGLDRRYSASPEERFFTGGGLHVFHNFKRQDDRQILSVREATLNSVNLVYIRLMRDIVRHYMFQVTGSSAKILKDVRDTGRGEYLRRFADREGREFIHRFYQKYKGKTANPGPASEIFFASFRHTPRRLAAAYRYVYPASTFSQFQAFLTQYLPGSKGLTFAKLQDLYDEYAPGKYSLADQGYIVTVHPLELWLVRYLISNPHAQYKDVIEASGGERVAVYQWLFKTIHKNSQDIRIRGLLELEAFLEIHRSWKRLGYPFDSLVPSLATAIGSSADHPAALAELMGIILNNGLRVPNVLIERMRFAADTPFETLVERAPVRGEQMFSPELAAALRSVLADVVETGTASRLARAIVEEDGAEMLIGGKTGTGDHRHITFSSPGVIKESRAVNRSATFVFFIGDRFFGTMTAFVPGAEAANYTFTSALSTQVMKHLLPTLKPLIDNAQPLPEQGSMVRASSKNRVPKETKEKREMSSS